MKQLVALFALLMLSGGVRAQAPTDLTKAAASPVRKAILDALRPRVAREAGVPVSFVVDHLKVQGAWAFMRGTTRAADGGEVPWARSPGYAELVKDGMFDGGGTAALLKKVGGRWTYVAHVIGPTDVAWACWWKEFGAPRAIFDLAEDCR